MRFEFVMAVLMKIEGCWESNTILTRLQQLILCRNRWMQYSSIRRSHLLTFIRVCAACFIISVTFSENPLL